MGCEDELLALKRVQLHRGTTRAELQFIAPEEAGHLDYEVYLISDSYIGLDQQHGVRMSVG